MPPKTSSTPLPAPPPSLLSSPSRPLLTTLFSSPPSCHSPPPSIPIPDSSSPQTRPASPPFGSFSDHEIVAKVGKSVRITVDALQGTPPMKLHVSEGELPDGLRLDNFTGTIEGIIRATLNETRYVTVVAVNAVMLPCLNSLILCFLVGRRGLF
jgi:hypothetical protein